MTSMNESNLQTKSKSNCCLQKRKQIHPLAVPLRNLRRYNEDNFVQQRVISAKLQKMKNLENQLSDAKFHLKQLADENRALKTLQKRQDRVLENGDSIHTELPRLLKSHEEENRIFKEKNKRLKLQIRDLQEEIKDKDFQLLMLRDQLKNIYKVCDIKELNDKAELYESLQDARITIKKYEEEISLLNRKLALETKSCQHKLKAEISKNKILEKELEKVLTQNEEKLELYERKIKEKLNKQKPTLIKDNKITIIKPLIKSGDDEEIMKKEEVKKEDYDVVTEICNETDKSRRAELMDKVYKNVDENKITKLSLKDDDFDIVNKIWGEEYELKKCQIKVEPKLAVLDKEKLLKDLDAIDQE